MKKNQLKIANAHRNFRQHNSTDLIEAASSELNQISTQAPEGTVACKMCNPGASESVQMPLAWLELTQIMAVFKLSTANWAGAAQNMVGNQKKSFPFFSSTHKMSAARKAAMAQWRAEQERKDTTPGSPGNKKKAKIGPAAGLLKLIWSLLTKAGVYVSMDCSNQAMCVCVLCI
jgi:hypothetical protein